MQRTPGRRSSHLRQRIDRIRTQIELHPAPGGQAGSRPAAGCRTNSPQPARSSPASNIPPRRRRPAEPPHGRPPGSPRDVAVAAQPRVARAVRSPADTPDASSPPTPVSQRRRRTPRMQSARPRCRPPAATRWCRRCRPWEFPRGRGLPSRLRRPPAADRRVHRPARREIAEMNTRDSQQYKSRQLLADPPASVPLGRPTTRRPLRRPEPPASDGRPRPRCEEASLRGVPAGGTAGCGTPAATAGCGTAGKRRRPRSAPRNGCRSTWTPAPPLPTCPPSTRRRTRRPTLRPMWSAAQRTSTSGCRSGCRPGPLPRPSEPGPRSASSGTSKPSSGPRRTTNSRSWRGGRGGVQSQILDRSNDASASSATSRELADDEYRAAEASILNAHYTDPAVAAQMWSALVQAGFDGGQVLEPGCGPAPSSAWPLPSGNGRRGGRPADRPHCCGALPGCADPRRRIRDDPGCGERLRRHRRQRAVR